LRGIGGWLAFYIWITLITCFLFPILRCLRLILKDIPLTVLINFYDITGLVLHIAAFWTAMLLLLKKANAVIYAKRYLLVGAIYGGIMAVLTFSRSTRPDMVVSFIGGVVTYIIWYNYFSKSKRVRSTYEKTDAFLIAPPSK